MPVLPGTKAVNAGRGFRILKMRHEYDIKKGHKNVTKNAVKKIFIFLIILHIKYEDKETLVLTTTEYKKVEKNRRKKL